MHAHNISGIMALVSASPRRGVSRHRDSSSTASTQTTVTSRQFSYSHKLNSTCLFSRSTELDSAVEMVRSDLADLRREMVGFISNILTGK